MQPQPLYDAAVVRPAFELRYSWTAWPFRPPLGAGPDVLREVEPLWEDDGLRLLERWWSEEKAERYRVVDRGRLTTLRDSALRIAEKKGHQISRLAIMPDHLHLSLRGNIAHSPQEIALSFQNNLAYALGQVRFLADTFYVGTFGEYDMWAIRRRESPR